MTTAVHPTVTNSPSPARPGPTWALIRSELRLYLREPMTLGWGLVFPVVLLIILGSVSGSHGTGSLDGLRLVAVYTPIVIAFVVAMLALNGVPPILAGYRERGVLRRLALTPAGARRILVAHLAVDAAMMVATSVLLLAVARLGFNVGLPRQAAGFVLTTLLAIVALLAAGLLVAAVTPSARAANAGGAILFFPCMFFAGLWIPREEMGSTLRTVGDYTPLGAAVGSLQRASAGMWPHPLELAVLATYAVVCGLLAVRWFRWT
jgi:ABC-2 type transport system permease protein